jgi:YD repeat-containing protein
LAGFQLSLIGRFWVSPEAVLRGNHLPHPGAGQRVQVIKPAISPATSCQTDGAHHVTGRTDAKGQYTGYTYDAYGRLTAVAHYPN